MCTQCVLQCTDIELGKLILNVTNDFSRACRTEGQEPRYTLHMTWMVTCIYQRFSVTISTPILYFFFGMFSNFSNLNPRLGYKPLEDDPHRLVPYVFEETEAST